MLDANGAYRAEVSLAVNNATQQFLDVRLPPAARLWTVRVAGEPVKPTRVPGSADPQDVRIPLIKTAAGEGAYDVVLKYGGDVRPLRTLGSVDFPMVRCQNIQPELSQAWLYLPAEYRWFDFGGTMHPVAEQADLEAGYVQFQTKQIGQSLSALREGDKWTKARAANTLKAQEAGLEGYREYIEPQANAALRSELARNKEKLAEVQHEVEMQDQSKSMPENQFSFNRQRLIQGYEGQVVTRSRNVVRDAGRNFSIDAPAETPAAGAANAPVTQPTAQVPIGFRRSERR